MLNILSPLNVKKKLRDYVKNRFGLREPAEPGREYFERLQTIEDSIPKVELKQKNITNLKMLLDRQAFLDAMPVGGVVAEIGVNEGEFSEKILKTAKPSKLHLVDAWGDPTRYTDQLKLKVHDKFSKEIASGQVEINVGFSTDVLPKFPDKYFDWVYLDTDHTYKTTAAELDILRRKMKPGGIIAGHDYTVGNWVAGFRYGVIEAVNKLCVEDDWELIYLTSETHQCRNFAIRKLS